MAADLAALRDKVQRILAEELGSVEIDKDGDWSVRNGSSRTYISVKEWGEDETAVSLWAFTNRDVPRTPELYKFVATSSYVFGGLEVWDRDDESTSIVVFRCTLLGDFLDPAELMNALGCIASTADKVDDEIKTRFGGTRFHED